VGGGRMQEKVYKNGKMKLVGTILRMDGGGINNGLGKFN
jgi:hypothetical protein